MSQFKPGQVISFSAGTTQTIGGKFRVIGSPQASLSQKILGAIPSIKDLIIGVPPFMIHCYPATPGAFPMGITIDTYLNPYIAFQSLQLAESNGSAAVLAGYPLFVGDIIFQYLELGFKLPSRLLIITGGYDMPVALQNTLTRKLADKCTRLYFIQLYGVAEFESNCLFSCSRDQSGDPIYHTRGSDIIVHIENRDLYLTLKNSTGEVVREYFKTGDSAKAIEEDKIIIFNDSRLSPSVKNELMTWQDSDWIRRTGYLNLEHQFTYQVRKGITPKGQSEMSYFEFAEKFDMEWYKKPKWT